MVVMVMMVVVMVVMMVVKRVVVIVVMMVVMKVDGWYFRFLCKHGSHQPLGVLHGSTAVSSGTQHCETRDCASRASSQSWPPASAPTPGMENGYIRRRRSPLLRV